MTTIGLAPEALAEVAEAAAWYESQRAGLAAEFLGEIDRGLSMLMTRPASFPRLVDVAPDLEIRRMLLPRFPYAVVFLQLPNEIRVIAVAHARRQPGYWLGRVRP